MSTGALQYLFRGYRDEAEQPDMEKKQPNGGGKPGECGTQKPRESVSRRKEAPTTMSDAPDDQVN